MNGHVAVLLSLACLSTGFSPALLAQERTLAAITPNDISAEQPQTTIFRLQHSPASSIAEALKQLHADEKVKIVPELVSNSVIVLAPPSTLDKVKALISALDVPPFQGASESETATNLISPRAAGSPDALLQGLRSSYQRAEQQAQKAGAGLRRLNPNAAGRGRADTGQLLGDVTAAFEARQNLQRAELAQMRERLSRIEQSIEAREQAKDKIIRNRVEELLNPNLQWEPIAESAVTTPPADPVSRVRGLLPPGEAAAVPYVPAVSADSTAADPFASRGWTASPTQTGSLILRSAEAYRESLRSAQEDVERYAAGGPRKTNLEAVQRQLRALQAEYAAQLRLLELELASAEVARETTKEEYENAAALLAIGAREKSGVRPEVERRKREAEQARVRLEQLKTLIELYRQAGNSSGDVKETPKLPAPGEQDGAADATPSAFGVSQGVAWQRDLEAAKQAAAGSNRLVLMHFCATWCHWCKPLEKNVFGQPEVAQALAANYLAVRMDYDVHREFARQYGVRGVPWEVVIRPDGKLVEDFNSPQTAEAYIARIDRIAASQAKDQQ